MNHEDTPIVSGLIGRYMREFSGAEYYEEVHQRLAPLARDLELALRKVGANDALQLIASKYR